MYLYGFFRTIHLYQTCASGHTDTTRGNYSEAVRFIAYKYVSIKFGFIEEIPNEIAEISLLPKSNPKTSASNTNEHQRIEQLYRTFGARLSHRRNTSSETRVTRILRGLHDGESLHVYIGDLKSKLPEHEGRSIVSESDVFVYRLYCMI